MSAENLWGDMPDVGEIRTPLMILREQASLLRELTGGLLEAQVEVRSAAVDKFVAQLVIIAPAIDGYKVTILHIQHGLEMYPVVVIDISSNKGVTVSSEAEYATELKTRLGSAQVQRVIRSLLMHVKASE